MPIQGYNAVYLPFLVWFVRELASFLQRATRGAITVMADPATQPVALGEVQTNGTKVPAPTNGAHDQTSNGAPTQPPTNGTPNKAPANGTTNQTPTNDKSIKNKDKKKRKKKKKKAPAAKPKQEDEKKVSNRISLRECNL